MNAAAYSLAAVLATGDLQRLYSGLSVLVSTATAGDRCAALATFASLEALLAEDLPQRAEEPTFARSMAELRDVALDLEGLELYACSASVETMSLTPDAVADRMAGVISTPRFLATTAGARLLFV